MIKPYFRLPPLARSLAVATLSTALVTGLVQAQTMDYNLSQAMRAVTSISSGLERLQQTDIHGFNRLSKKLNKAAELLQTSESQSHPEFASTVQQWTALQQQMMQIAVALQQAQIQTQAQAQQQNMVAVNQSQQADSIEAKTQARLDRLARENERKQLHAKTLNEVLTPMTNRYGRGALPKLVEAPTPEQARDWAESMHQLKTSQLESDLAQVDILLASDAANEEDAHRAKRWMSEDSQRTINELIRDARLSVDGSIVSIGSLAAMINSANASDPNQAFRFAGRQKYGHSVQRLDYAIRMGAVAQIFNEIFGAAENDRSEVIQQITAAREKLDTFKPIADKHAIVLDNAEPANPPANKDFLAPIAQEFWLDGDVVAESDAEGGIWVAGNQVADITHNGEIWIDSNEMGSIEPNGEIWFDANRVGSLEANGEVWRNGNQVGLIEQNGTAWINGSAAGEITPFHGEWKRAAIIYYFPDFFARR